MLRRQEVVGKTRFEEVRLDRGSEADRRARGGLVDGLEPVLLLKRHERLPDELQELVLDGGACDDEDSDRSAVLVDDPGRDPFEGDQPPS